MTPDPRVDSYLRARPEVQRDVLQAVRDRVRSLAPHAVETISYGMPAFKIGKKFLLSYAGWKRHCSIYPIDDALLERHAGSVQGYGRTKGSLHFSTEEPLPVALLDDLIRARVAIVEGGGP